MKDFATIRTRLENYKVRSAWSKGVKEYAFELLENLEWWELDITQENMLNGARNWSAYSWGGLSLIYDTDIANRLCTPSELKRTRNGERKPNANEQWLDTQARALYQASRLLINCAR